MESFGIHRHMRHFHGGIPAAMSEYSKQLAHLKQLGTKVDYYSDCDRKVSLNVQDVADKKLSSEIHVRYL